jgi:hypothetical protein
MSAKGSATFLKVASTVWVNVFSFFKAEFVRSKAHSLFKKDDILFEKGAMSEWGMQRPF